MTGLRRRLPTIAVVVLALMVLCATPAFADPITDAAKGVLFGQSNPMLSFIQLHDSRGINVWQYELSIDRGNPITATDKWFWSKPVDTGVQFYRDGVLVGIWMVNWVLRFEWVGLIGDATMSIGNALHDTMGQLGLAATFLTIAGIVGAIYIFRGKTATGVWEILAAVVIAAGLSTFLANPVQLVLNPGDGVVYKVRDTSMDFVAAVAETPELKGVEQTDAITADLIDTFIRKPLQLVNFGMVIDGTPCEAAYDEALKSGPHAWDSTIRDKINDCSSDLGEYAANPSPSMLGSVIFLYPAVAVVLLLALAICGSNLMAGIRVCYQAGKSTVTSVVGVLPGAARRPFLGTIADLLIAMAVFVFTYVFLALFLKVVQLVLGGAGPMSAPQRMFLTDVLLVAGLVIYLTNKKRIQQSAHRLKDLLASRPGGTSGPTPPPTKLNTAAAISAGADVARLVRAVATKGRSGGPRRTPGPSPLPAASSPADYAWAGGNGGGAGRAWQVHRPGPGGSGGGGGIPTVTGRVLTGAAELGLAHVTGGASTVALAAYRGLKPRPALPPGPSSTNPSLRRPSGPTPAGPGRSPRALPPGPTRKAGPGQSASSPKPAIDPTIRRPRTGPSPAARRSEQDKPAQTWPVRNPPERPGAVRRPQQANQVYIRRQQGRRGQ